MLGGTFEAGALPSGGFRMTAWLPAHDSGPLDVAARTGAAAGSLPDTNRLRYDGIEPRGARAPLPDEILTWPRVLGSGCLTVLVVLPTVAFLIVLLADAVLS